MALFTSSLRLCRERSAGSLSSAMQLLIHDSPDSPVFQAGWLPVYGRSTYLRALQQGSGPDSHFVFPEIRVDGEVVALGCFQELHLSREAFFELGQWFPNESGLIQRLEHAFKGLISKREGVMKILVAGNCQISGPYGLFFHPDFPLSLRAELWSALLRRLSADAGTYSITLIKDIPEQGADYKVFSNAGDFNETRALPVMKMEIQPEWQRFDDYLKALSAKYRIRAKAALKKGQPLELQLWGRAELSQHGERIMELYEQVFARAQFRLRKIDLSYFLSLFDLDPDFRFRVWLHQGKPVGFSTLLLNGKQADAHLVGIDYEANKSFSLYLNILYQYVSDAIELRMRTLDLGRTAMEIKSSVGAVPVNYPVFVKLKNPLLNSLACLLAGKSDPEPWIQRHPFRQEEQA